MTASIFEAKTNLSELIKKVQAGETVVITSGRERTPVAKLTPLPEAREPQRLGLLYDPKFELGEAFWEPMSDEETGYADDPLLQVSEQGGSR